jgi:cytochrome-b5 reductase
VSMCDSDLSPPAPVLSPSEFRTFKVLRTETLTPDTKRYTVGFPREHDTSGISTASAIVVKATVDGKDVVRPYTPVSPAGQRGSLDLIIKTYPEGSVSK